MHHATFTIRRIYGDPFGPRRRGSGDRDGEGDDAGPIDSAKITLDSAVGVAEKHINGRAVRAEYERQKDGRWVYDVEVKTDTGVSDVQIDPDKGTVLA